MDPSPLTVRASQQDHQLSPPQPCEEEAAQSLLLLKDEGGFQDSDLEAKLHPVGDESTTAAASLEALPYSSSGHVKVTMDAEVEQAAGTVMMLNASLPQISAEAPIQEQDAPLAPAEGRRCRRNNGRGWWCSELAHPGYAMCWQHTLNRRENFEKLKAKRAQASSGSVAMVPEVEGTMTAMTNEANAASSGVSGSIDDSDLELRL